MLGISHLIGHRGAARLAPENTLAGIELAARLGLRWVEIDARLSRDGVPVLVHDNTLDRTTDLTGPVRAWDYAALAQTDAGRWFAPEFAGERIPRLDAVLARCRQLDLGLHLELKPFADGETDTAAAVAGLVSHGPRPERLILSSFAFDTLAALHARLPRVPRAHGADALPADWLDISRALALEAWHLDASAITADLPVQLRAQDLALRAWTVNRREEAQRLVGWGVEAVFTDDPPALLGNEGGIRAP